MEIKRHGQWIKQIYRWIGYYLAMLLSRTPVKPNHVTVSRLVFIGIAAILIQFDNRLYDVIAAISIFFFSMLDACDGSLATITKRFSLVGTWLDPQIDRIGFLILFSSIAFRLGGEHGNEKYWIFLTMFTLIIFYFRSLIPAEIRLKEKYRDLRVHVSGDYDESDNNDLTTTKQKSMFSAIMLQFSPHTHNVALYLMIALILDALKIGIILIAVFISLWWAWENAKVMKRAASLDRQSVF